MKSPAHYIQIPAKGKRAREQAKVEGHALTTKGALMRAAPGSRARVNKAGHLVVKTPEGQKEYFTASAKTWHKVLADAQAVKLANNQVWRLQLGAENGRELSADFRSIEDMNFYLSRVRWENSKGERFVSLVLVTDDGEDFEV